jgi:pyrroloquinoline quinone biosynthesis protein E
VQRLLPSRVELDHSLQILKGAQERLRGRIRVEYVVPDYYAKFPKACMGGWGRKVMLVTPGGDALPCHAAGVLPGMAFENVSARSLRQIWEDSDSFQKFRGEAWMSEPCRNCERRTQDYGGCRCQAFLLAKDETVADPVCSLSPHRNVVDGILAEANSVARTTATTEEGDWLYRSNAT